MLSYYFTLHNHVVSIRFYVFPELRLKHSGHHPLISRLNILQTKRHYSVVIISNKGQEGSLLLVD